MPVLTPSFPNIETTTGKVYNTDIKSFMVKKRIDATGGIFSAFFQDVGPFPLSLFLNIDGTLTLKGSVKNTANLVGTPLVTEFFIVNLNDPLKTLGIESDVFVTPTAESALAIPDVAVSPLLVFYKIIPSPITLTLVSAEEAFIPISTFNIDITLYPKSLIRN